MSFSVPSVDPSTNQFPDSVRAVQAANLADPAQVEGAAVVGAVSRGIDGARPSLGSIVVCGDSIAAAYGASDAAHAYPALMPPALGALGFSGNVVAAGVSGDTTTDELVRLPDLLAANSPSAVVFQASINDSRVDKSITSQQTADNVRAAVNLIRNARAIPVIVNSTPMNPAWFSSASYSLASARKAIDTNAMVAAVCQELDVTLVDMFTEFFGRVGVYDDGLHPNDVGHQMWADAIAAAIAQQPVRASRRTLFSDGFGRPDSATTAGLPWVASVGTWGVSDGRLQNVSHTQDDLASVDVGASSFSVAATCPVVANSTGVIARMVDTGNFYLSDWTATATAHIYKRVAGAYSTLLTKASGDGVPPLASGGRITFVADGPHLMTFLDGYPHLAVNDSTLASGTGAGVRSPSTAATGELFDDFAVIV